MLSGNYSGKFMISPSEVLVMGKGLYFKRVKTEIPGVFINNDIVLKSEERFIQLIIKVLGDV